MDTRPYMIPCKTPMETIDYEERITTNNEVNLGYSEEDALIEANRCLDCPEKYCTQKCPVSVDIPAFIKEIKNKKYGEAYKIILNKNPMPGVSSRVCPRECQCESDCTRGINNEPVAIGNLERFVADFNKRMILKKEFDLVNSDKKIAIVGAGPAGLTCAISLAESGFEVVIYEKDEKVGGVLSWGIPSFVLPKSILENLVSYIKKLKIKVKTSVNVGEDVSILDLQKEYDSVFVATGSPTPLDLDLEGRSLNGVVLATDFLKNNNDLKGKNVVVIGGGNTAVDCARVAVRSGAKVSMLYRRTIDEMPATLSEIGHAQEENINIVPLVQPLAFNGDDGLKSVKLSKMEFTKADYPGGRKNVKATDDCIDIDADVAVIAVGFKNVSIEHIENDDNFKISVNKSFETNLTNVYAGGDAVTGPSTVMKASSMGKDAAVSMFSAWIK